MRVSTRASTLTAIVAAMGLVGLAMLAGVLVTAEPSTRSIAGVVTLVEWTICRNSDRATEAIEAIIERDALAALGLAHPS